MAGNPLTLGDRQVQVIINEDNARQIENAFDAQIAKALEEIGLLAEGYAKKACPVDTGRLRASITHQIDTGSDSVYIGTNVEYGVYVEMGTRYRKAKPYLKPAATEHGSQYRSVLRANLES